MKRERQAGVGLVRSASVTCTEEPAKVSIPNAPAVVNGIFNHALGRVDGERVEGSTKHVLMARISPASRDEAPRVPAPACHLSARNKEAQVVIVPLGKGAPLEVEERESSSRSHAGRPLSPDWRSEKQPGERNAWLSPTCIEPRARVETGDFHARLAKDRVRHRKQSAARGPVGTDL